MSSFKGDSYYEAHVDDPDYRESSEDESAESEIPASMQRLRANWVVENYDVLKELYQCFKGSGHVLFGNAFYQLGGFNEFCNFVFKYTMPGATT
jgi:gentisate 1,2-dioxygenase